MPALLAPAGDWECARAAVENGADAIYFGLERFNARMRAQNFTEADLPNLMALLHRRGVRGYVTMNTLIFPGELAAAAQYIRAIVTAGVDGVIVQDIGLCQLIREISPDFPIHASTQMTITSHAGVEFARGLGASVVVLARECSLKEIAQIQAQLTEPMALETFVHGALCVAYSGQCLTSEALGGRSANRGECAQACRMPYELIVDGERVDLADKKYLLSPQDLAGLEVLPELVQLGVASLKIEGRLKSPEYVANVTRVYRQALDRVATPADRYDLEMSFSRGLHTGWLTGIDNQALVHARFGKKRGVYLGQVLRVLRDRVELALVAPLKPGDGVVFDGGHPEAPEQGGHVYSVVHQDQTALLGFGTGDLDWRQIRAGDRLWKTRDPELDRRVRQSYAGDQPRFQRPLDLEVHGHTGTALTLIARDREGQVVELTSTMNLETAQQQALDTARLTAQLGRLGGTPFVLGELVNALEGLVHLPLRELNRLRREAVEQLEILRTQPRRWQFNSPVDFPILERSTEPSLKPELLVLVRNLPQLIAALDLGLPSLYVELEDPRRYREAVRLGAAVGTQIWVAPPRITKSSETWMLRQVLQSQADGYLLRNYDQLVYFQGERCRGDFSLNVANYRTAHYLKTNYNLERLTCSYDLNVQQLEDLMRSSSPEWFEVTIHQHMPMFHMEHCVFCAFLSEGTDYTNCGRPCEKYEVKLRDRVGVEHMLKADVGCRNTLFNGRAQTGAEAVDRLKQVGVRYFRVEFVQETPTQLTQTLQRYQQLLAGTLTGPQLWRDLKLHNQLGVTRGQG